LGRMFRRENRPGIDSARSVSKGKKKDEKATEEGPKGICLNQKDNEREFTADGEKQEERSAKEGGSSIASCEPVRPANRCYDRKKGRLASNVEKRGTSGNLKLRENVPNRCKKKKTQDQRNLALNFANEKQCK